MQLGITHVVGLMIIVGLVALGGVGIGYMEIILRILRNCSCHKISELFCTCCKKDDELKLEAPKQEKVVRSSSFFRTLNLLPCAARACMACCRWIQGLVKTPNPPNFQPYPTA